MKPSRLLLLGAILFAVFAVYAPALRLMPLHDDAVLMPAINNRSLITIFEIGPTATATTAR